MTTTEINQLLDRLLATSAVMNDADRNGILSLRELLDTVPGVELNLLSFKKPKVAKKATKLVKPPSPGAVAILQEIRGLYDDEQLQLMTSKDIEDRFKQICKGVNLPDLKNAATQFVGGAMSKLKKADVLAQIVSKIMIKHSHLIGR